jgi:hypothetical protein
MPGCSDLLIRAEQIMERRENGLDGANGVARYHEAFGSM